MALFHEFVESSVQDLRPPAAAPPPVASAPKKWEVTGDLLNQKWGQVLRTLDPTKAASTELPPPSPSPSAAAASIIQQQLLSARRAPLVPAQGNYAHLRNGRQVADAPGVPPQYTFSALKGKPGAYSSRPTFL